MIGVLNPLAFVLADYYARAGSAVTYIRKHNLDQDALYAHAGSIAKVSCRFDGRGHFELDDAGEESIVVEVYDADDETTIDLVAWPVERPNQFATALRAAAVL